MKKLLTEMEKGKQISFFSAVLILFTMLAGTRYYLNENIYKAFNLGNLGGAGGKIELSTLFAVCLAVGFIIGVALSLCFRQKFKGRGVIYAYATAALMAIVLLLFTPYNLQLLAPTQNLQNIAMINFFAVLVFSTIAAGLVTVAIVSHILLTINDSNMATWASMSVSVAVAIIIAFVALAFKWSYAVCVAVYASVLLFNNILHSIFYKDNVAINVDNVKISATQSESMTENTAKSMTENMTESTAINVENVKISATQSESAEKNMTENTTVKVKAKKCFLSNFKLSKREIIALSALGVIVIALLVGGCFITAPLIAIIG